MSGPRDFAAFFVALRAGARLCLRQPVGRFRHPWISVMPPSIEAQRLFDAPDVDDDRFVLGDYSLGLFHHDVSEAAIALAPLGGDFAEACFGSLLCFLDCAEPNGLIHRIELPQRARDVEPAKPVMAQLALRAIDGLGPSGLARAEAERVLPRLLAFVDHLERHWMSPRGLFLTPSARASGFDSDILTAGLPERTIEGPDTNTFMVLEYRALAELARRLGDASSAERSLERAEALRARIDERLWFEDERGGLYTGFDSSTGAFVTDRDERGRPCAFETWVSLLPLYAGIPSAARAALLVRRLLDPDAFFGPVGIRTLARRSPYFTDARRVLVYDPRRGRRGAVSNWTGPVWSLSTWYLARGLERYGYEDEARDLDGRSLRLLASDLARTGRLHECYDDAGVGLWPPRGTFMSWNVLALTQRAGPGG
ncbi:MAG: trehalase family glycosidase [Sandaracinaceae bacterium]